MNISKKSRVSVLCASLVAMLVLTLCIVSNNSAKSKANQPEADSYEQYLPTIEQLAKECGLYLANQQCPDVDISVKDTTPIYDVTNNIVGYSVAFESNGADYGYANLNFTTDELFTDFAISENANNLHSSIAEDFVVANSDVEADEITDKLYNTNGIDYAVSAETDGEELFFYNAETYTSEDFEDMLDHYEANYIEYYDNTEYEDNFFYGIPEENNDFVVQGKIADWFKKWIKKLFPSFFDNEPIVPTAYPEHSEVLKKSSKVLGELAKPVMLPQYSVDKSLVSQETIMTTTKKYACGLVALTGICAQEDILVNGNIQDTFHKLWDVTGTENGIYDTISNYGVDGIVCSGTSVYMMGQGMRIYGHELGVNINYTSKMKPTVDFFQSAVNNGLSSVLCYQIADKGGHGVSILGYTTSKVNDQTFDYIVAADGWFDDAPRYVMYYPELFESTTGLAYMIQK
ncbi:MAG: hypothetical protein E7262_10115 [Lachnospiraceae bacterium]|nr:hypothetical protein [Lachnospiraceae bacterium]